MSLFTPEELAEWSHGTWVGDGIPSRGVSMDSRKLAAGDLFLALKGERSDGHDFVPAALRRGASGAVVHAEYAATHADVGPLLVVDDTRDALHRLAKGHRNRLPGKIIGVTGSVGKTTVKEMTADVLHLKGPTARTKGNWNNELGLPLSMLTMHPSDRFGVFEAGMNHPGELAPLMELLQPQWGLVTVIGAVHLEHFHTVEAIAEEKAELLKALPPDGLAFLDVDGPWFDLLSARATCPVITISMRGEADYMARDVQLGAQTFTVEEGGTGARHVYRLPLPGTFILQDALWAVAVGREAGIESSAIAAALANFIPQPMRWERKVAGRIEFINDAYNANPVSMRAALSAFSSRNERRRWLVFAGMLELGDSEQEEHRALGREVAYGSWAGLITVGDRGRWIADGAISEGFSSDQVFACADIAEAAACLAQHTSPGDAVLLKASRDEHLERVIDAFAPENQDVGES